MLEILITTLVTSLMAYLIKKIDGIETKLDRVEEEVLFLSLNSRKRSTDDRN